MLNKLADLNGTVIFGGTEDREIPLCELKQAFELDSKLYNRSIAELSIEKPTPKDKGAIMKTLMPKVKGKADGKLVNEVLASMM